MSYKGRYYSEACASQQQDYRKDSSCFQSMDTEDNYVDDLDPEKLLQCPYDKNHKIRACRFPYHLVKCRKNHPDIVQKLVTCPFNARHQIPREDLGKHIASCDDKRFIEEDIVSQVNNHKREVNVISSWQSPPCEENWDEDLGDQSNSVFIWGTSRCAVNSSASNPTVERKNWLPSCLRVPRSLPYEVLPWKKNAEN